MVLKRFLTSKDKGHRHTWRRGDKRTSKNSGHTHAIDLKKGIAKKGKTDHSHRLLQIIA